MRSSRKPGKETAPRHDSRFGPDGHIHCLMKNSPKSLRAIHRGFGQFLFLHAQVHLRLDERTLMEMECSQLDQTVCSTSVMGDPTLCAKELVPFTESAYPYFEVKDGVQLVQMTTLLAW
jgi:hypothetical protein